MLCASSLLFAVLIQQSEKRSCVTWSLLSHLQAKIKFNGPITVAEYMKLVLTNPESVGLCIMFFPELQIRGSTEDNSKIIFLISQQNYML